MWVRDPRRSRSLVCYYYYRDCSHHNYYSDLPNYHHHHHHPHDYSPGDCGCEPKLVRFMGRPSEMTPKAWLLYQLGSVFAGLDERLTFPRYPCLLLLLRLLLLLHYATIQTVITETPYLSMYPLAP